MDVAISVRDVCKTFKLYARPGDRLREALHPAGKRLHERFEALQDVSFTVEKGQTVGVLGRNGAGKSTLLGILTRTLKPTSGAVTMHGRVAALLELGTGFDPMLSGRDNVLFYGTIHGVDAAEMQRRLPAIEAFADIGVFFDRPVKTYSSGMFARLAFAAAIHTDPEILILDEILSVGDACFQEKCYHRLRRLQEDGTTIVFVSHDTTQVQRLCRSAILLDGGRLLQAGAVREVVDTYHALIHGSAAPSAAAAVTSEDPVEDPVHGAASRSEDRSEADGTAPSLAAFARAAQPLLPTRPYYNKAERRLNNGQAQLDDIMVAADGRFDFTVLSGQERLSFYLKVSFREAFERPHLGWAVTTREGVIVSGTNTLLSEVALPPVQSGETCLFAIHIQLNLNAGDFFVNLGLNANQPDWTFLDVRRAVIHLPVRGGHRSTGFIDTPTQFERVTDAFRPYPGSGDRVENYAASH